MADVKNFAVAMSYSGKNILSVYSITVSGVFRGIKNHAQRTWYCFSPLKGGGRLAPREGKLELSHGII